MDALRTDGMVEYFLVLVRMVGIPLILKCPILDSYTFLASMSTALESTSSESCNNFSFHSCGVKCRAGSYLSKARVSLIKCGGDSLLWNCCCWIRLDRPLPFFWMGVTVVLCLCCCCLTTAVAAANVSFKLTTSLVILMDKDVNICFSMGISFLKWQYLTSSTFPYLLVVEEEIALSSSCSSSSSSSQHDDTCIIIVMVVTSFFNSVS
mmetsp:Transcript_15593/g.29413  ORF Transcript_15593/g.29413 Transcript_15593/m.29413 type:complete len:208 (+) Transcript_15593:1786-2409(+)